MSKGMCQEDSVYKQELTEFKHAVYDNFRTAGLNVSTVDIEYFDYGSGKFNIIAYLDITSPIFYVDAEKMLSGIKLVLSWSKKRVKKSLARKNYMGCAANVLSVGIGSDGNQSVKYVTVRFSGTTNASE